MEPILTVFPKANLTPDSDTRVAGPKLDLGILIFTWGRTNMVGPNSQ